VSLLNAALGKLRRAAVMARRTPLLLVITPLVA